MKQLKFTYKQACICTKCGNVTIIENSTQKPDTYKSECLDCYDRKSIKLKNRKRHLNQFIN